MEEEFKVRYYVDIPQLDKQEWVNIKIFDTKEEAIAFVQEVFGGDERGYINLISQS